MAALGNRLYFVSASHGRFNVIFAAHWLAANPTDAIQIAKAQYKQDRQSPFDITKDAPEPDALLWKARVSSADTANAMNKAKAAP